MSFRNFLRTLCTFLVLLFHSSSLAAPFSSNQHGCTTPNNSKGAHFIVPPDALEQDVAISMTPLTQQSIPDLEPNQAFLGIAHFEPSGLVFKKPALFNTPLPETNPLPVGASIEVIVYDHNAGKWITEPQNGKIIEIQGQKFAQLEILHFTHNGGSSSSPLLEPIRQGNPYSGCVRYQDGANTIAAELVATNQGYTDQSGNISFNSWSSSPSLFTLNPKSDLALRIPNSNTFECIILPKPETGRLNPIQPLTTDPCDPTPIPINKGATARNNINSTNTKQLLLSSQTQSLYTRLLEFSKTNIDPSSLTITVNNQDVTKKVDFTQVGSTVLLEYKLLTNLPARADSEFVIRAKSRGTVSEPAVMLEVKSVADVVAKIETVASMSILQIEDADADLSVQFPAIQQVADIFYVIVKKSQFNQNVEINIPTYLKDEAGNLVPLNSSQTLKFDDSTWNRSIASAISGQISNGTAQIKISLIPSQLNLSNISFKKILGTSTESNLGSSQVRPLSQTNSVCFLAAPLLIANQQKPPRFDLGLPDKRYQAQLFGFSGFADFAGGILIDWFLYKNGRPLIIDSSTPEGEDWLVYIKKHRGVKDGVATVWQRFGQQIASGSRSCPSSVNVIDQNTQFASQNDNSNVGVLFNSYALIGNLNGGISIQGGYTCVRNPNGTTSITISATYLMRDKGDLNCDLIKSVTRKDLLNVADCGYSAAATLVTLGTLNITSPQPFDLLIRIQSTLTLVIDANGNIISGNDWPF